MTVHSSELRKRRPRGNGAARGLDGLPSWGLDRGEGRHLAIERSAAATSRPCPGRARGFSRSIRHSHHAIAPALHNVTVDAASTLAFANLLARHLVTVLHQRVVVGFSIGPLRSLRWSSQHHERKHQHDRPHISSPEIEVVVTLRGQSHCFASPGASSPAEEAGRLQAGDGWSGER